MTGDIDPETRAFLKALQRGFDVDIALAAEWETMTPRERRQRTVVEYRCASRNCQLLTVWLSEDGTLAGYRPAYTLSPTRSLAQSNESGRTHNTTDGLRRWRAHTFRWAPSGDYRGLWGMPLTCDHVHVSVEAVDIQADVDRSSLENPIRQRVQNVAQSGIVALELAVVN